MEVWLVRSKSPTFTGKSQGVTLKTFAPSPDAMDAATAANNAVLAKIDEYAIPLIGGFGRGRSADDRARKRLKC
jgi:hypothetical protein